MIDPLWNTLIELGGGEIYLFVQYENQYFCYLFLRNTRKCPQNNIKPLNAI